MTVASPRALGLMASAVAGTKLGVAPTATARAWSDGETIYVPNESETDRYAAVLVQAAMVSAGSLSRGIITKMTGRQRIRDRYITLEAARAVHRLAPTLPRALVERVHAYCSGAPSPSAAASYQRACGSEPIAPAPPWFGTIRPAKLLLASGASAAAPTDGDRADGHRQPILDDADEEHDAERSAILELFSAPLRSPIGEALQRMLGGSRAPATDKGGGHERGLAGSRTGRVGAKARPAQGSLELHLERPGTPAGWSYPEWDYRTGRYRPGYCTVNELDPAANSDAADIDDGDIRLRRELARLGLAFERNRHRSDGDDLDLSALIDTATARAAGEARADGRVYEVMRRSGHDLGVVVLLDITGSTSDCGDGRRVFDDQREVAARLLAALAAFGNRVAGYGFQSWGRTDVRYLRIMDFGDRYDMAARRRLAAMTPAGFTRLGAAVRHGAYLLSERSGVANKLLIVIGDGLPYDDGYEHVYAREDSRRALHEARIAGVGCACLSVKTSTRPDTLEHVWGHIPSIRVDSPADMSRHILPVLRRSLREAAALGRDGRTAC